MPGASTWAGYRDLNDEFLGIEAESRGTVDDWTPEQRDCYPRLCAAIMHFLRRGADRVAAHKEVCLPRGRKIDPAYWDMNDLRGKVGWMLADPQNRIPRGGGGPAPAAPDDEEQGMNVGSWAAGNGQRRVLACPVGPNYFYKDGWFSLCHRVRQRQRPPVVHPDHRQGTRLSAQPGRVAADGHPTWLPGPTRH